MMHVWESKDNLWELVLPFHHMGPGDQTQFFRLDSILVFCFIDRLID